MSTIANRALTSDQYGRRVSYLRISITDRCNFHCFYCQGNMRQEFIPHTSILRYEEIMRLVEIMKNIGIGKIRITGGEPLMRRDCIQFLWQLRHTFPDMRLCITTNGSLLDPYINDLLALKLDSINISLDSLDRETFKNITGKDDLPQIMQNIERLLQGGQKVKLNAVAIRGISDKQINDFMLMLKNTPIDLRFIEFMPMGINTLWDDVKFISCSTLYELASQIVRLEPVSDHNNQRFSGPAIMFNIIGSKGRLGFISAVSQHFCMTCNRLRLTSNGNLRTCLFADKEYKLTPLLRNAKIKNEIIEKVILRACHKKGIGANLLQNRTETAVASRQMVGIGG